jgi:cytochrome c oxidase subunit 3
MKNVIRSKFQAHPYHLVSPSPWPLYTSISLLALTTSGVSTMHGFYVGHYFLILGLISVIYSMFLWFRDIISEGKLLYLNLNSKISNYFNINITKIITIENIKTIVFK